MEFKMLERFDINNNRIRVATCRTCGHNINTKNILSIFDTGLISNRSIEYDNMINELLVVDILSGCCEKPDYIYGVLID